MKRREFLTTIAALSAASVSTAALAQTASKTTEETGKKPSSGSTVAAPRVETFANGLTVSLTDQGKGPAILVLHGGGGPLSVAGFSAAMSATNRVLTPTQPGFQGTPRPDSYNTIADVAVTYIELLERLKLKDVLVIGFSMGGWVASEIASRAGDRLRGVILVDGVGIHVEGQSVADIFPLTPQQLSAISYHDPAKYGLDPSKMSDAQKKGMAANFKTLAVYATDQEDPALRSKLANVKVPALIIWGDSDRIISRAYSEAYAHSYPNGKFVLIENSGHLPQIEQPARLLELVHNFDAGVSSH